MTSLFMVRRDSRLLLALILLLLAAPGAAQDSAVDSTAGDGVSEEVADGENMPEALRSPTIDFFATDPTLQAHKLRGLKAEVAGLILGSPGGGDIVFEALVAPLRGSGGNANVPLFIEIDGPTFLATNQHTTARVEIYAYALGVGQEVVAFLAEVFAIDIQELGEAVWQSGIKYYGHLDLPPGEYRLRILVRNYLSKAAALREIALTVPAFDSLENPFIFPVFQPPSARDAWLAVREWDSPEAYPFWVEGRAVSPSVRPVLVAGRRSEIHVLTYGLPTGAVRGHIELLNADAVVASADLKLDSPRESSETDGNEMIAVSFEAPEVPPGVYSLRMEMNGADSAPTSVILLEQGTRDRALLWTDLRGQLGGGAKVREAAVAAPPVAEERVASRKKRDVRQIRKLADSYRQALSLLGTDQSSAARSALLDLEAGVLTEGTLPLLKSAQLAVAEQLSKSDVESLLPVLALHDELYATYRQRSLFSLGFHAREMIESLAEIYAERGASRGSHIVAARALASLGGHLQAANLPSSSRRLYQRALTHDAHSQTALLGLATSFERYGDYPRAITPLEDLVQAHPDSGEGLLRLAVNLDRLGVRARARTLIERVIDLETSDWVKSLAYQILARVLIEIGNLEQAAQLLETSLEANPSQHGTICLLAHIYDRLRRPYDSLNLLENVAPSQDRSPRKLYDSWPETSLHAIREALSEAAAVRVALVAKILEEAPEQP